MEARCMDPKDPHVTFDLLTVWASEAFGRYVDPGRRRLDGWEALLSGLRHVARQRASDARAAEAAGIGSEGGGSPASEAAPAVHLDENLTERKLRACLASVYKAQQPATVAEIVKTKLADSLSLFAGLRSPSVEHALSKWSWYLYCLTFETDAFLRQQKPMVVNVPLDTVDLRAIANIFNVQIVVTRMLDVALRFSPPGLGHPSGCCHLLLHSGQHVFGGLGGLWAALLDVRSPAHEPVRLENAIVEVDEVPQGVPRLSSERAVFIQRFDKELRCYVATSGDTDFLVERSSIKRVLFTEADHQETGAEEKWPQRGAGMQAWEFPEEGVEESATNALEAAPEGSLEFQVLHELVRRTARQRLEHLLAELAGRSAPAAGAGAPR